MRFIGILLALAAVVVIGYVAWVWFGGTDSDRVGSVDTEWKLLGPDHKIIVDGFNDPKISGVACHIARARTGGVKGAVGIAEDTSDASVACRQIGPIRFLAPINPKGERVYRETRSVLVKKLRVIRYFDVKRNTLVYLAYSEKIIKGSPKNSLSTVPLRDWNGIRAGKPRLKR